MLKHIQPLAKYLIIFFSTSVTQLKDKSTDKNIHGDINIFYFLSTLSDN